MNSPPWVCTCVATSVIRYLLTCIAGKKGPIDNEEVLAQLDATVAHFQTQTFAASTSRTYATHMRAYMSFCNGLNIQPVPISHANIARYVAYLASRLSYNSICQYLNIIRLLHLESGLPNPLEKSWYHKSLMQGCKRALGQVARPKLPITLHLLKQTFLCLDLTLPFDLAF